MRKRSEESTKCTKTPPQFDSYRSEDSVVRSEVPEKWAPSATRQFDDEVESDRTLVAESPEGDNDEMHNCATEASEFVWRVTTPVQNGREETVDIESDDPLQIMRQALEKVKSKTFLYNRFSLQISLEKQMLNEICAALTAETAQMRVEINVVQERC